MAKGIRRCRAWGKVLHLFAVAAVLSTATTATPQPMIAGCQPVRDAACKVHHYRLAARVRPLFFWINKDNVGEAQLTWLEGESRRPGYGLLIGSDPARAPRKINRWGYVSEIAEQGGVRVFGLMTETNEHEQSFEEAKTGAGKLPQGTQVFKVIHATVSDDAASGVVKGVALSDKFTFRDLDAVVSQVPGPPSDAPTVPLPPGTEPGFLNAMTSLMHENVEGVQRTGVVPPGSRRSYVFANKVYTVVTRSSRVLKRTTIKGREFENVIESEFEARLATRSKGGKFRVAYGTEGTLREVPVRIVYRPNWWFEAEAVLIDD